jgi:mono/diheme cytochrome c family protein
MNRRTSGTALLALALTMSGQVREVASHRLEPADQAGATRPAAALQAPAVSATGADGGREALLKRYCQGCHNERVLAGGLALDTLDLSRVGDDAARWERVVRKLRAGVMPPAGMPRPPETSSDAFVPWLQTELDSAAARNPNPGRTETLHRLNRTEYHNAIRDLLTLDIDVTEYLPADDSSFGFDNIGGALNISQSLLERYLAAARTISRLAVGSPLPSVDATTYRLSPSLQQHDRADELPFGTRGGTLIRHLFPQDGDYDIRVELSGATRIQDTYQLEITVDSEPIKVFSLSPRRDGQPGDGSDDPGKLELRVPVRGGPRAVGAAFFKKPNALIEGLREPVPNPRFDGGPGGPLPGVTSVTIIGPHDPSGPGDTPSRRRIFVCRPANVSEEWSCARTIVAALVRRAHRGADSSPVVEELLGFFKRARAETGSFDAGIEAALRSLLVSPQFLFRIEADPATVRRTASTATTGGGAGMRAYRISDLELASRLSFFLWSSIPDDELLDTARRGGLREPAGLERQVRRMLQDSRSEALTTSFASQWLQLRNLDQQRPGDPYSLAFDETLRNGLRRETELFFDSIVRENRGALELLTADYTFVNDRVALHYNIPFVQGSHFRRVVLPPDSPRRGILGHGSILTLTSHAIRTSPVLRGKWLLNAILGTPPPDPPPNVPSLADERTQAKVQTMRERMAQHRANPSCAGCHSLIDPVGFALENFDAIGRWRTVDESFNTIDATGMLPDGTKFDGVKDLRSALVRRPERFVTTLVERLLTYGLGRGLEYYDMPAVRKIVRESAADGYRVQRIVQEIVRSYPFQMRSLDVPAAATAGSSAAGRETTRR